MAKTSNGPKDVRERVVALVLDGVEEDESRWQSIKLVASKMGFHPETLRNWVIRARG